MDFIRMDPVESRGMVVARVTCSPTFHARENLIRQHEERRKTDR